MWQWVARGNNQQVCYIPSLNVTVFALQAQYMLLHLGNLTIIHEQLYTTKIQ